MKSRKRRGATIENRLADIEHEVLVAVSSGRPLTEVMHLLCVRAEELAPNGICSILRVDAEGRLRPLAAPSLPDAYSKGIDGVAIGPMVGSCGSAAYYGHPVEVTSIRMDPRWAEYREPALRLGLRACWSSPIKSHEGRVLGTFAFYFTKTRKSTKLEKRIVEYCAHLCALAIGHWEAQTRIHRLAYTDVLTGLGNRAHLTERFPQILAQAAKKGKEVAVLYADLDGFRTTIDLHGHRIGDLLLRSVAERMRAIAANADLVTRLGGDEFLIVKTEDKSCEEFEKLADALSQHLCGRYGLDGNTEARASASIGIACYPRDGKDLDALMAHADTALCRVKRDQRAGYAFYTREMDAERHARRSLERDVSLAVEAGQLSVVYQPQANTSTLDITGFEALARWKHPIHGFVSPQNFIPAAEACGAIKDIGAFVLREALAQASQWSDHLRLAVNVSPAQIVHANFAELVEEALRTTNVAPTRLEIEVTESLFIYDSNAAMRTLQRLKSLGVSVSIDDFGTGYSSLSTLRSFPFDRIKIDRSFVVDMVSKSDAAAIVNSILGLGRALGRPVVAEGVESQAQLAMLRNLGCDEIQGYLLGKPLPIAKYARVTKKPSVSAHKAAAKPAMHERVLVHESRGSARA